MRKLTAAALAALGVLALAGFSRELTQAGGLCVSWTTRTPHYAVNLKGSTHLNGAAQFTAVTSAFATWAAPTCTDMKPVSDGTTPRSDLTYNPDAGAMNPNVNLIVWRPTICSKVVPDGGTCTGSSSCDDKYDCLDDGDQEAIALTTYFSRSDTGGVLSAGIELNDYYYVFTTVASPACDFGCLDGGAGGGHDPDGGACGAAPPTAAQAHTAVNWPCVVFDVQDILTHEAGHFLGFGESSVTPSVMGPLAPAGDLSKRTLQADDQAGLCAVYPAVQPYGGTCDAGRVVTLPKAGGCGCATGERSGAGLWLLALGVVAAQARARRRR